MLSANQHAQATLLVTYRTLSWGLVGDDRKARDSRYCRQIVLPQRVARTKLLYAVLPQQPTPHLMAPLPALALWSRPRLRVERRTRPFDTHSPREPGRCWGCCGNPRQPQCKGDQTRSTLAKAVQSQSNRARRGREGIRPGPEESLGISIRT